MRIAQVAPLFESVPPRFYGGTERVVSYLTEELVRLGHDVTLFASGDSHTSARLVKCCATSMRLNPACLDPLPSHVLMIERVLQAANEFDVIHFHTDSLRFPAFRRRSVPNVTTLHGRLDLPEQKEFFNEFSDVPVVSISSAQRSAAPQANWKGTVYHGLPVDLLPFNPKPGSYLAFLGRLSQEKRVDRAIEIARRSAMTLKIAAKVDPRDEAYYKTVAEPMMKDARVEFVGEIAEKDKASFLGQAQALLFPIEWPEPFGMVMIEAMACGTPVIAFDRGSVREVLVSGVDGFIVNSMEEAVQAVERVPSLSRAVIRRHFEDRFSVARMANDYVRLYERLIDDKRTSRFIRPRIGLSALPATGTDC